MFNTYATLLTQLTKEFLALSIAGRLSNCGDEYQLAIALNWVISLLFDENIEYVQVDAVVLPDSSELTAVYAFVGGLWLEKET